jgi:hypothetical protein
MADQPTAYTIVNPEIGFFAEVTFGEDGKMILTFTDKELESVFKAYVAKRANERIAAMMENNTVEKWTARDEEILAKFGL